MTRLILAIGVVCLCANSLQAQSLADVAKAEAARRAALIAQPVKVITKDDLKPADAPAAPAVVTAPATTATAGSSLVPAVVTTTAKDEAYWKGRMRGLRATLDTDVAALQEITARLSRYQTMVNNSEQAIDGVPYVSRQAQQKKLDTEDEFGRATARVQADRQAIQDLEEEARKAKVSPGWLRP